jgi:hypothetical protein
VGNYVSLEQIRGVGQWGDLAIDQWGVIAIDSAEEAIESYCDRRFYQGGTADIRYYTADSAGYVLIDDLSTLASLKTDDDFDGVYETTWASTERVLAPYNAAADSRPYTKIEVSAAIDRTFPATPRGVQVTGTFGWPAIPDRIVQATLIQAQRFLKRARSSPMAIESVRVDGTPIRLRNKLDPDVEVMLGRLVRHRAL